jgi:hypothetical protein
MKRSVNLFFVVITMFLASCASTQGWHEGENLIQPLPLPGEAWQFKRLVNDRAKMGMGRWSKNSENGSETLQVITAYGQRNGDVEALQSYTDEEGKGNCSSFSSEVLDNARENNYQTITWRTKCKLRGENAELIILQKAISGEDSLYNIQKMWRDSFTEESSKLWTGYVKRIKLCNTRGTQHPCPEGFRRTQ